MTTWINGIEQWLENILVIVLAFLRNLPICDFFREIGIRGVQEALLITSTGYFYITLILFPLSLLVRWWVRLPRYDDEGRVIRYKQYAGHTFDQRLYQSSIFFAIAGIVCIGFRAYLKYA